MSSERYQCKVPDRCFPHWHGVPIYELLLDLFSIHLSPWYNDLRWWVDSIQVRSECPLPHIAQSSLCLSCLCLPFCLFGQLGFFPSGTVVFQPMADVTGCVGLATPPCKASTAATDVTGRGRGRGYRRGRASGHRPDPGLLGGPTVQTPQVPRHHKGLPIVMTDAWKSFREPCVLKSMGGPPSPIFKGCRCGACTLDHSWCEP